MPEHPVPDAMAAADAAVRELAAPRACCVPHEVVSPNGTRADVYYWLRDDERKDPAVLAHLARENQYTEDILAPLAGLEQSLFEELTARLPPDDASVPVLHNGYWYYARFAVGLEYPIHARRRGTMDADEEVLLDGNELACGHAYFQIGGYDVSPDTTLLAYAIDTVGRRQFELHVKDLRTARVLPDRVQNVEPDILWAGDSRTILYIEKDPLTLLSVRLFAHALGSAVQTDRLVYEETDHSYYLGLGRSRSEQMLFISCTSTQQSEWHYARADDPALQFRPVLARADDHEYEVEQLADAFIIRTNWQAPNFRIVHAPIARCADKSTWRDVLAHHGDRYIESYEVSGTHLAVNERSGGLLRIRVRPWTLGAGAPATARAVPAADAIADAFADARAESRAQSLPDALIAAPEAASTMTLVHTPGLDSLRLRYVYSSLTTPRTTYDFDLATGRSQRMKTETFLGGFDRADYVTEFRMAPARDGTPIPVSLAYRTGTPLDGTAPLYQYGYGAYGLSMDPAFRSSWVSLMDRGFVVAIAHVRGGQEMGRAWFEDGRLLNKRNSFTDFIDVTDALVRAGTCAADRVCAQGGSAGGLLMGAVANMAPQRYRAIVAHVPFVDVVTSMLDESIPLTTNEFDQWGDPRDRTYHDYMLSYSPYDNVRAQDYPAMLVFTGLWDSQVQYYEPAKWVARMRALRTDANALLFSIDMNAGHGGKSGRYQRYRETAREYAFLLWQLARGDGRAARQP